jgi:hypothetical protein
MARREREASSGDEFIELRVKYPGHPYVAHIDGLDESCHLHRRWIGVHLYDRRDHLSDDTQEQVYRLPLSWDAIYEVAETINGRRTYRYVAVCHGNLHRVTREAVEAIAEGAMTLQRWYQAAHAADDGDVR